ncbi:protein cereblon isoform X2 [Onthophagus taurus]|uniref:protein cereblon isoform X2 n=1 Tax=Onthophagus taurus TaxID=166361 RepID=UPI000C20D78C|nr:protein cereblon isoform X2 [Onthophagus taurus]
MSRKSLRRLNIAKLISCVSKQKEDDSETGDKGEFDTALPTTHKYLGKLDNVGGYTLYDDGEIIQAMLAIHTNTLVFPGFTLPLVIREYETDHIMDDIKNGYMFALICTDETSTKLSDYGVIMEVFETSVKRGSINLKAKGRQRCQIVAGTEIPFRSRLRKLTVKVLPEPYIHSPINSTQLQTLKSRRTVFSKDYKSLMKNYRFRRYHLSQFPFASWVYDWNELSFYVNALTEGLKKYYSKEHLPEDPNILSYWFVQNYQLTHNERLQILKCASVLDRLKLELKLMKMARILSCGKCRIGIAFQRDIFAMSKDGIQSNYCNPGGNVYETVTVMEATNFTLVGESSKQFSWFPGYAWTIMQCAACRSHLGWQFTSKNHHPQRFFGLAHSCLDIKIVPKASLIE